MAMKLCEYVTSVETKYGSGTIRLGSRGRSFRTKRWHTGIFDFDAAIGGGPVWGRIMRVYGPFSGGKSALWHKAVAGAQGYCRNCRDRFRYGKNDEISCSCVPVCPDCNKAFVKIPFKEPKRPADEEEADNQFNWEKIHDEWVCECLAQPKGTKIKKDRVPKITHRCSPIRTLWVDAENCFDAAWSERLGQDNDLVFVVVPEYAQQAADIVEMFLRSGEIDIVVVDSIAELVPSEEIENSTEEWTRGLHARVINKAIRKWAAAIASMGADADIRPSVLLVNQTRESMERGEVTPGGWQQYFKSSIDVRMGLAKYKYKVSSKKGERDSDEVLYADVTGVIKKNKTHPPRKRFSYRFYLSNIDGFSCGSTNELGIVLQRALEWQVIECEKKGQRVLGYHFGEGKKRRTWKTQKAVVASLADDNELFWAIRDETMDLVVKNHKGL